MDCACCHCSSGLWILHICTARTLPLDSAPPFRTALCLACSCYLQFLPPAYQFYMDSLDCHCYLCLDSGLPAWITIWIFGFYLLVLPAYFLLVLGFTLLRLPAYLSPSGFPARGSAPCRLCGSRLLAFSVRSGAVLRTIAACSYARVHLTYTHFAPAACFLPLSPYHFLYTYGSSCNITPLTLPTARSCFITLPVPLFTLGSTCYTLVFAWRCRISVLRSGFTPAMLVC